MTTDLIEELNTLHRSVDALSERCRQARHYGIVVHLLNADSDLLQAIISEQVSRLCAGGSADKVPSVEQEGNES